MNTNDKIQKLDADDLGKVNGGLILDFLKSDTVKDANNNIKLDSRINEADKNKNTGAENNNRPPMFQA